MGPDARTVIERERQAPGPSPSERRRMRQAIAAALAAGVSASAAGTAAASKLATAAAGSSSGSSVVSTGLLSWLGGGLGVGALVVAGSQILAPALLSPNGHQPSPADSVSMVSARAPLPSKVPVADVTPEPPATPPRPDPSPADAGLAGMRPSPHRTNPAEFGPAPSTLPKQASDSLREEYALLEQAHRAIEQGQNDRALGILAQHQRRFANGQLSEERQAARVLALCASGRVQAHSEAKRFLAAHPKSLLGPRVRQECGLGRDVSVTDAAPFRN